MIVKSFTANTVAGALKKVRGELGGDAVILKTKRLQPDQQLVAGAKVEEVIDKVREKLGEKAITKGRGF